MVWQVYNEEKNKDFGNRIKQSWSPFLVV